MNPDLVGAELHKIRIRNLFHLPWPVVPSWRPSRPSSSTVGRRWGCAARSPSGTPSWTRTPCPPCWKIKWIGFSKLSSQITQVSGRNWGSRTTLCSCHKTDFYTLYPISARRRCQVALNHGLINKLTYAKVYWASKFDLSTFFQISVACHLGIPSILQSCQEKFNYACLSNYCCRRPTSLRGTSRQRPGYT